MSRQQAEGLLIQAMTAKEAMFFERSLTLYRESLAIWIELYKGCNDATEKADLFSIVQSNMEEAEKVKALLEHQKTAPVPPVPATHSTASSISAAIASMLPTPPTLTRQTSNNNEPKPNEVKPVSAPKPVANTSGKANPAPTAAMANKATKLSLPDYHDYTNSNTKGKAAPSTPSKTAARGMASPKGTRKAPTPTAASLGVSSSSKQNKEAPPAASAKPNEYSSQILDEIVDKSPAVRWDDIAGLRFAKQTLQEAVILPNLRPDLFTGLRRPPKGVLLYGPPGTGKTLLAKAVATESGFTFFSISAASVTSKYLGEGEKLMRALFEIAREKQPSVIFFDEIDALMSARKENEHEASRRLKTEFMTQIDGATSSSEDRILVMAATNLPWDLDEAVLRRMAKRIYVPLPDVESRKALVTHLLTKQGASAGSIHGRELDRIVSLTEGYSGSDLSAVCHEAALGPIREISAAALRTVKAEDVRPMNLSDFEGAIRVIRPSVSGDNLNQFQKWSEQYGVTR